MKEEEESLARKAVAQTVAQMSAQEKKEVLTWAERSLAVVSNKSLTRKQKILALRDIKQTKPILRLLTALLRLVKNKTWTGQSWARRLGVISVSVGAITFGSQGAGLAAFGTAKAAPLLLLTTVGATFLGVLIDEIKKEGK